MITQETAAAIWHCYREITASEKLLADMAEVKDEDGDKYARTLRDVFGHRRDLTLGVPSGDNGHRIFGVSPELGTSVIRAHIANKRAELVEANERARIELNQ